MALIHPQKRNERSPSKVVGILHILVAALVAVGVGQSAIAAKPTTEMIQRWVKDLDAPRFATRRSASQRLKRAGVQAVPFLAKGVRGGSLEKTSLVIRILGHMAVNGENDQQSAARLALEKISAVSGTIAARKAGESLRLISRTQEYRAIKDLKRWGARIGEQATRELGPQLLFNPPRIYIGFGWRGETTKLGQLRFIHSVKMAILEGNRVDDQIMKHVSRMPRLEVLIVKNAKITDKGISHLQQMKRLRQLTVKYCSISDESIAMIAKLDRLSLVKLYGTKITPKGIDQLRGILEFANIDFRRGAFLGVACEDHPLGCRVNLVQPGSSAERAGMLLNDVIVQYNGKAVKNFNDLTKLIGKHKVGDKTGVVVLRRGRRLKLQVVLGRWE